MTVLRKNWDDHAFHAEELARTAAFIDLRERILAAAAAGPGDVVADLGAGTGLLTLALAPSVRRVWAIDISPVMGDYTGTKAESLGLGNVHPVTASVVSLPLGDRSVDVVVSNYCFHHLSNSDKRRSLAEIGRILTPGGRLVFGDMMFRTSLAAPRDREILRSKVHLLLARGIPGVARLLRAAVRQLGRGGERPADPGWWRIELGAAGFESVAVEVLEHEGGIAHARKPDPSAGSASAEWSLELAAAARG